MTVLWIKALAAWKEMGATGTGPRETSPPRGLPRFLIRSLVSGQPAVAGHPLEEPTMRRAPKEPIQSHQGRVTLYITLLQGSESRLAVGTDQNGPPIRPLLGPLTNSEQGPSLSFKRGCELRPFLVPDLLDIGGLRVAGGQDYSTTSLSQTTCS